jgi:cold shock protein
MSETTTKLKGTVKFFNNSKGFGFLKENDSTKEYFVHVTNCIDKINENDEVEFEVKTGPRGENAVNVKLI